MKKTTIFVLLIFFACNSVVSGDEGGVEIHGFISQGYLKSSDYKYFLANTDDGTFEFNEIGINFGTDMTDNLRLGMQFMAKDLGTIGNDKITIDWAYADYRYRNWLGLRVGKVKKPMGLYNQTRDIDAARNCIILPVSIYEEKFREATMASKGASVYGTLPGSIDYQLTYGIMTIPENGGVEQSVEQDYPIWRIGSMDSDAGFNGEILWNTPLEGLRIGTSYAEFVITFNLSEIYIDAATAAGLELLQGLPPGSIPPGFYPPLSPSLASVELKIISNIFSFEYTFGNFMVASEYNRIKMKSRYTTSNTTDSDRYYIMASYRLTDWFEPGFYYSIYYADNDTKDIETSYSKDFSLTTRFDINDSWILKFEGHMMDGLGNVNTFDPDDPTAEPDSGWYLFAAKLSYSF